ncbi:protein IQ-DOMAIN 1-like [Cucurbita moschata]|uniref:Protein IQ-DOMAIN 1-like n=1 Tax=Cucurbita moschata TaxID=3662 RepID=A0A6J1EDN0_CUCMO|nr:protein IQ-DOMAIN 1-like [Cucurbita moschata]XP_022925991.1 protein IQ-DOMAIN 1-like [Cucurbita moschata]
MGKKGTWFSSVKKALSPDPKHKKNQNSKESKKKWFGKQKHPNSDSTEAVTVPSPPQLAEANIIHLESVENNEPCYDEVASSATQAYEASVSTTIEPNVATPFAAAEVVQLSTQTHISSPPKEEVAAIKIQTVFRGYLARRALRALRGLVRLKSLMESSTVKRQASNTLRCMQTLARVQSQIQFRRVRMLEENQALQKQLLQKHAKDLESLRIGEEWDDSLQSKEQIEAGLLSKYEAATRRERALAYAFTHQQTWKNSARSVNPAFMDPTNPTWGWSWLERWSGARVHDAPDLTRKELNNSRSGTKTTSRGNVGGEISKSFARFQLNSEMDSPTGSHKTTHSAFKPSTTPSKPASSCASRKLKPPSPRILSIHDDDSKSTVSVQSERLRRHSTGGGSSVRDDDNMSITSAVRSYMTPTESAKAKSRLQSPMGVEKNVTTPEKGSSATAKKRLSYPPSPARPRRHSGPPKIEGDPDAGKSLSNGVGG